MHFLPRMHLYVQNLELCRCALIFTKPKTINIFSFMFWSKFCINFSKSSSYWFHGFGWTWKDPVENHVTFCLWCLTLWPILFAVAAADILQAAKSSLLSARASFLGLLVFCSNRETYKHLQRQPSTNRFVIPLIKYPTFFISSFLSPLPNPSGMILRHVPQGMSPQHDWVPAAISNNPFKAHSIIFFLV